ncbi:MAG: hypothetical protein K2M17_04485 [Bacilli bacterium]|nr:hypothetical protein [Bacilli bacterium]
MKKLLVVLVTIFSLFTLNVKAEAIELPEKTDHEIVKLYIFYGNECSHCHEFMDYFINNYKDEYKDYFEIVAMETWKNKDNNAFALEMKERFSISDEQYGVPFIIIGDYYKCGFSKASGLAVINEALKQYQNEDYEDIVAKEKESTKNNVVTETLREAAVTSGVAKKEGTTSDAIVIGIIFAVVIAGLGGLVYLSRKK